MFSKTDKPDKTGLPPQEREASPKKKNKRESLAALIDNYTDASNELEVCNVLLSVMQCCNISTMPHLTTAQGAIKAQAIDATSRQDKYLEAIIESKEEIAC